MAEQEESYEVPEELVAYVAESLSESHPEMLYEDIAEILAQRYNLEFEEAYALAVAYSSPGVLVEYGIPVGEAVRRLGGALKGTVQQAGRDVARGARAVGRTVTSKARMKMLAARVGGRAKMTASQAAMLAARHPRKVLAGAGLAGAGAAGILATRRRGRR